MGKILGYGLMGGGLVLVALPIIPGIKELIAKLPIQPVWVMIAGLVLLGLGFVFLKPSSSSQHKQASEEVPIYHGEKIVGYRRAHKN